MRISKRDLRDARQENFVRSTLSRRSALTLAALLADAITLGDALAGDITAEAAVPWRHPFQTRASIPPGGRYLDRNGAHKGLDLTKPRNTSIHSVAPGAVTYSGLNSGWGQYVIVTHSDGYQSLYAHLLEGTRISTGTQVNAGDVIGRVGLTGRTFGYHLHIEIFKSGSNVDPYPLIYNAPLAKENVMTPKKEALLKQVASNVAWIKSRIGGSTNEENLATVVGWTKSRIGGSLNDENLATVAGWTKSRIGGSVNGRTITQMLS